MKKLILMSALVLGGLGIKTANAQLGIRINLNLGNRPVYVPAPQPVEVDDYYYLPEVEAYYSVGEHSYYYQDNGRWISAAYLPGRYHDFDWRSAKRFEVHANRPYMRHDVYRGRFGGYSNRNDFYARAYPGRDRYDNDRGREQYGNRDWNQPSRGGNDRNNDRNERGYNQPNPGRNQGSYNQPSQGQNQGGNNQSNPGRNQGSYNQPGQGQNQGGSNQSNPGRNQGGYNQGGNQSQPAQGQSQQGGRGQGQPQGGSNGQPANQKGGQDRGNTYTGGEHYTANKMGVVQDRGFSRPVRN